ncbi:MAG: anthranilate synthase component I, partial [Gammaproteobacteria bacterium]
TPEKYQQLVSEGYNRIPVMQEILADLDTPLSTYLKLAKGPYSYLFESVQGGEKWGRYSIIGLPCKTVLTVKGETIELCNDGQIIETVQTDDPLDWIEKYQARFNVPELDGLPRFRGGLVGYFGYDTIRYIEPRLKETANPDPLGNPDILLMLSEELVVFDTLSGKLMLIVYADSSDAQGYDHANARIAEIHKQLCQPLPIPTPMRKPAKVKESDFISGFTQEGFETAVRKVKDYIVEGDAMQVVLSQRLSVPYKAPPIDLYRALRSLNPSPYMFFLDLGDFNVVGSSPEILVRLEEGEVTVRPIAGTRPRGATPQQDHDYEKDLLTDPKELAEHLMLIDLGRNDAGRVSKIGTVKLTEKMLVERYSHVMHIVSNVIGEIKDGMTAIDVLRATFPAGTVSGAPKIRAMEIIDELEPVKRGVYAGAVGYLDWSGNMDTAIAIRTAVIKDEILHIQAGAGIVADSIPANEWDETMNKGRAIFRAVALAQAGLDGNHR